MTIPLVVTKKEVRRSTSHIMVTARYSNQQESKSRKNSCQAQPTEHRKLIGVKTMSLGTKYKFFCLECCHYFITLITSYREDCLMCFPSNKVAKRDTKRFPSYQRVTRRQVMRHFTSNGTDQYQNGLSNFLIAYREQPRSTRIIVAYPGPAFSATKRTNHAPIRFDQQV